MSESFMSFLDQVKQEAEKLGEQPVLRLVEAVEDEFRSGDLHLLILGAPGSGRSSLTNVILGYPDLLPSSPVPKLPVSLVVKHGPDITAEAECCDGMRVAVLVERLRDLLTNPESEAAAYSCLTLSAPAALLRDCVLQIESFEAPYDAAQWKTMLAASDYVLLVLSADALLSEEERGFVRDLLQPSVGLERVAIILNKVDQVEPEERHLLSARIRAFLGAFESQPVLLSLSALQARRGLEQRDIPRDCGYTELMRLIQEDLLGNQHALQRASLFDAATLCLTELESAAARQTALLAMDDSALLQVHSRLTSQTAWLADRVARAQGQVDLSIGSFTREDFLREVDAFSDLIRQQLPDEIASVSDLQTVRQHLPGYIEALWRRFFNERGTALSQRLYADLQALAVGAQRDLQELVKEETPILTALLDGFNSTPSQLRPLIVPQASGPGFHKTATLMQVGGLASLLMLGSLPLAIGLIGVGQVIRWSSQKSAAEADRQALVTAARTSLSDHKRQVKEQVNAHFDRLVQQTRENVAAMYRAAIDGVADAVQQGLTRRQELQGRRDQLTRLHDQTLPALHTALQSLSSAGSAKS